MKGKFKDGGVKFVSVITTIGLVWYQFGGLAAFTIFMFMLASYQE